MKLLVFFQGRYIEVTLEDLGLYRTNKGDVIRCPLHAVNLSNRKEAKTHLKFDHFVQLSELWKGGRPA